MEMVQENNDELYVPNWLVEVLAWIKRMEMANSELSTASRTFNALCWPKLHGNVKGNFISQLIIGHKNDAQGNAVAVTKIKSRQNLMIVVPILNLPLPDYILGCQEIELRYLDAQILAFIERIVQHCGTIELNFSYDQLQQSSPNFAKPIRRLRRNLLLTATEPIRRLMNVLMKNDKTISLNFLTSDSNLNLMEVFKKLFYSDTDNNNAAEQSAEQKLFRLAKCDELESEFIEYLKNDFLNATQPANIFIYTVEMHAEFTMENAHTGETLQLYHKRDMWGRFLYNYLIRHPCSQGAQWKREGEKKIMESRMNAHKTQICMNIVKIGNF